MDHQWDTLAITPPYKPHYPLAGGRQWKVDAWWRGHRLSVTATTAREAWEQALKSILEMGSE